MNRTGVAEVLAEEGFERLWPRPHADRGLPRRATTPRTGVIDFTTWPQQMDACATGLLLAIPDLVALDQPATVAAAGHPGTIVIPAVSSILSLPALTLSGTRRVSHIGDLAADPGAALFAGLTSLPKATALTTYSYRTSHTRRTAFLSALTKTTQASGVLAFADHWPTVTGRQPGLLVFDSKVTTRTHLADLTDRGIGFLTLRSRSPKLTAALHAGPAAD